jgi:acyl-CoA hydrolase
VTADFAADAALHSRVLIAEINHSLPRSLGSPTIPIERFAAVFESGTALHEHPEPVPDETELAIAAHVARLVEDGDTLQMGVGRIPTAVLRALASHTDLGVHSGIITPAVDALVRLGVVTGGAKAIDRGKVVAGSALGDRAFYDRVLHDPAYEFRPTSYTHSPANLARVGNLVAINSSIAVDLRGQVSAEVKDGRYIGAVGGQGDFARAASSTGRCSIIAQRSTSGGESMIVETLPDGLISTAKSDVDYLVTEHGVADLRGKGFLERAERIASVAAPAFRDGLLESVRRIR